MKTLAAAGEELERGGVPEVRGGDPEENARILRKVLSGEDRSPRRDVVLLNSAAAMATEDGDFAGALKDARESLDSGAALARLDQLTSFSQKFAAIN